MPGDNCSLYGCTVSRRSKHKGIAIFKIPTGDTDFEKKWREKLISIITKDRVIDAALRERINCRKLFICQRHYREDQILNHATRKTVKPGEIPELNLPIKSIPTISSSTSPRKSAGIVLQKKLSSLESAITTHNNMECYRSFSEFLTRVPSLKLHDWETSITSTIAYFNLKDDLHLVPKFEIYVDQHLSFTIRFFLWRLPNKHEIYSQYNGSLKNITLSNIIKTLLNYYVCTGLSNSFAGSFLEHSVPKIFSLTQENISPLCQTKWYRSPSCQVLNMLPGVKCSECVKSETTEKLSLKRKRDNMDVTCKTKCSCFLNITRTVKAYTSKLST